MQNYVDKIKYNVALQYQHIQSCISLCLLLDTCVQNLQPKRIHGVPFSVKNPNKYIINNIVTFYGRYSLWIDNMIWNRRKKEEWGRKKIYTSVHTHIYVRTEVVFLLYLLCLRLTIVEGEKHEKNAETSTTTRTTEKESKE